MAPTTSPINPAWRQSTSRLRLDWGLQGARAVATSADIAIIVDVLSFSTAVTVAVDRGGSVYPYRWDRESVKEFALNHGAVVAVPRSTAGSGGISLSPGSIRDAAPFDSLVLPSPNGSTISEELALSGALVVAGCLRNRAAVATWLQALRPRQPALGIAIAAAGEQWPNGALRPALEDFLGAGLIAARLIENGWPNPSAEAVVAASASRSVGDDLLETLAASASGRELVDSGWPRDVEIAAELDGSSSVPVLLEGRFVDAQTDAARALVAQRLHLRTGIRKQKDDQ